jgi:hypothetical protein
MLDEPSRAECFTAAADALIQDEEPLTSVPSATEAEWRRMSIAAL